MIFTPLASDSFAGVDGAELGANWDSGYSGLFAFEILSNRAIVLSANTAGAESYNAITWPNDQYSQITLINFEGAGLGDNLCGVMLRAVAPATNTYYLCYTSAFTAGTVFEDEIVKSIAGSWTSLANATPASAWVDNDILRGAVLGTDLWLYKNGVEVLSASDSALTSGRGGMYLLWFGAQGTPNRPIYDDWVGGEVEAEAGFLAAWAMRSNIVVVGTP